jgi:predicted O-methyltransferase YrrM
MEITQQKMEHYYTKTAGESSDGWFTYPKLYSEFIENIPNNSVFVEVGSWKGKSTAYLGVEAINSGKNIKCYAVDTWEGSAEHTDDPFVKTGRLYQLFLANISQVSSVVTPIRKSSIDAAKQFENESIDIVFIDACHEYHCVREDIDAWLPKVKPGGTIAGHDYYWGEHGVKRAVDETFGNKVVYRNPWENCWIVKI